MPASACHLFLRDSCIHKWGKRYALYFCHKDRFDALGSAIYGIGMMRIAQFLFVAAFLTAGCSRARTASPAGGLSSEQFVSVMVELHQAQPHQRPSILEKFETTDAEIRAFVRLRSRDPSSLSEAFDSIQARIDRERFARQTE
jgi:hypothetical protein